MPEVTVVVAAHDQARWLGEAIASVRAQTFTDWELIVVDDGSTDDTCHVVERHAGSDRRVRYLFQRRQERATARNRGIAAGSGRYVAFLDADDRWRPDKLRRQVAALDAEPIAGMCYTAARFIGPAGEPLPLRKPPRAAISGDVFGTLMRGNLIVLASVVVRRACLDAVGAFDPAAAATGCEDWDLWLRIAARRPVIGIDDELTLYRRHGANTRWQRILDAALWVIDKWYADPETARRAAASRRAVRARHFWLNAASIGLEDRRAALRLALRALRETPRAAFTREAGATLAALVLPPRAVRALRTLAS